MFATGEALCLKLVPTDIPIYRHGSKELTVTQWLSQNAMKRNIFLFTQETGVARYIMMHQTGCSDMDKENHVHKKLLHSSVGALSTTSRITRPSEWQKDRKCPLNHIETLETAQHVCDWMLSNSLGVSFPSWNIVLTGLSTKVELKHWCPWKKFI